MRKISLFLLLVMLSTIAFAQKNKLPEEPTLPIDERSNLVTYQDVVNEPGTPQELYDRAMRWVKEFYKNTAEVVKKSDRDAAVIEMRSSVRIYGTQKDGSLHFRNIVYYNFKLECRNNRHEIRFALERSVVVKFFFEAFLLVIDVGRFEADVSVRVFFNTNVVTGGKGY